MDGAYVVFDLETTGLSAVNNRIIEIGAVKVIEGKIVDRFSTFVNPREPIPFEIEQLTSISDEMVIDAPVIEDILPKFLEFCEGCVLIAHNASFDAGFIQENCRRMGIDTDFTVGDTVAMARIELKPFQAGYGGEGSEYFAGEPSPGGGRCGLYRRDLREIYSDVQR